MRDDISSADRPKKKKPKGAGEKLWASLLKAFGKLDLTLKIIVGVAIVAILPACVHPIGYLAPVGYGLILMLLGGFFFLAIAFNDSPLELLLCMLVPFYSLFYLVTHWEETKGALFLQLFGVVVCFSFVCAMPFHALVYSGRAALMGRPAEKDPFAQNQGPKGGQLGDLDNPPKGGDPFKKKKEDPGEEEPPFGIEDNPLKKKKEEPKEEEAPVLTGDRELDKLLANLDRKERKYAEAAAKQLAGMAPNQHRAIVAKKLAECVQATEDYNHTPLLRALQVWATTEEVPMLVQLLSHKSINTRNEALDVVGKLKDERAVKAVVRCFVEFQTRYHGEQALKEMGPVAEKEVLALLSQKDQGLWVPAIRILQEIGTQQSIPTLQAATQGDLSIRSPAQSAIAAINARTKK